MLFFDVFVEIKDFIFHRCTSIFFLKFKKKKIIFIEKDKKCIFFKNHRFCSFLYLKCSFHVNIKYLFNLPNR